MFIRPRRPKGIWRQISSTFKPNHIWIDQDQKSKPVSFTNKNKKHNLLPTYSTAYEDAFFWFYMSMHFPLISTIITMWYMFKYCFRTCFRGLFQFLFQTRDFYFRLGILPRIYFKFVNLSFILLCGLFCLIYILYKYLLVL